MTALVLDPGDMVVVADDLARDEFDDLLARPAAGVTMLAPEDLEPDDADEPVDDDPAVVEAFETGWAARLILEEGVIAYIKAKFDEGKHPRWPEGTPDGKGGEFMQIGERFTHGGKPYEISAIHDGKVVAHSASGSPSDVKELVLPVEKVGGKPSVKGIKPLEGMNLSGGKTHKATATGLVTIDPFVESATHDPLIPKPPGLHLSNEEWARFGKEDQEHFLHVEQRFGDWSPDKSKSLINEIQKQYEGEIQSIISSALAAQYGSSSGYTLSLAQLFQHLSGDPASLKKAQKKYEKAKLLLRDTAEAIQWDLYHRTKSPDVAMFHWGGTDAAKQVSYHVTKGVPIMSGYSMSTGAFQTSGFGSTVSAVPIAIRHVEMHTHSGGVVTDFSAEYEITTGARMKVDDRAFFSDNYSMPSDVKKYLQKMAKNGGEPASGAVLYEANKALKDPAYELPLPAEKPEVTTLPISGATKALYKQLSPEIAKKAGEIAHTLSYAGEDKEAAKGTLELLGVKPGDFIEGMKGTRYIIIADPGDPTSNLRYLKIDPNTKLPDYNKSFPFNQSAGNPFYRLEGHLDIPEPEKEKKQGFVPWTPEQYAALKPDGAPVKIGTLQPGQVFLADDVGFEVVGQHGSGKVQGKSLSDGKMYLVNSAFKASAMSKTGDWTPPPEEQVTAPFAPKVGDKVMVKTLAGQWAGTVLEPQTNVQGSLVGWKVQGPQHPNGVPVLMAQVVGAAPLAGIDHGEKPTDLLAKIEKGDKFAWNGQPFTVTTTLKGGTVKARGKDGKVQPFDVADLFGNAAIYRPSTWGLGNKVKVGDLDVGDVVHGGAGAKVRPYQIAGKAGSKVWLRNLETGEVSQVTKNKSMTRLLDKKQVEQAEPPSVAKPDKPVVDLGIEWQKGEMKSAADMGIGVEFFAGPGGDSYVWEKTGSSQITLIDVPKEHSDGGGYTKTSIGKVIDDWHTDAKYALAIPPSAQQVAAKPEIGAKFDQSKYAEGDKKAVKDLAEGDVFLSPTGLPMQLKSKKPKGGATAIALHNGKTVKNISYDKTVTTLGKKPDLPLDPSKLAPKELGDPVLVGELDPGDVFIASNGEKFVITQAAQGDQMAKSNPIYSNSALGTEASYHENDVGVTYVGKESPASEWNQKKAEKAFEAAHGKKAEKAIQWVADDLPKHPDYVSYMHPKSGKHKYPLVKDMPVGTVFTDKAGHAFKVKQSGGQAVITDIEGEKLFSIDGSWRGKVVGQGDDVGFIDNTPDYAGPVEDDTKVTVGDLKKGDKFTIPPGYKDAGTEYEIVNAEPKKATHGDYSVVSATNLATNEVESISTGLAPQAIKAAPANAEPTVGEMGIGTKFTAMTGAMVYTVASITPENVTIEWTNPTTGKQSASYSPHKFLEFFKANQWKTVPDGSAEVAEPTAGPVRVGQQFTATGSTVYTIEKVESGGAVTISWPDAGKKKTMDFEPGEAQKSFSAGTWKPVDSGSGESGALSVAGHAEGTQFQHKADPEVTYTIGKVTPKEVTVTWTKPGGGGGEDSTTYGFEAAESLFQKGDWKVVPGALSVAGHAEGTQLQYKGDSQVTYKIGKITPKEVTVTWTNPAGEEVSANYGFAEAESLFQKRHWKVVPEGATEPEQPAAERPAAEAVPGAKLFVKGDKVFSVASMKQFEFAYMANGKIVYKGANGKLFALGEKDPVADKKTGKLFALKPALPDPDALVALGISAELKSLPEGAYFMHHGKKFQVLGVGKDGITGQLVDPAHPHVAFTSQVNEIVQPLEVQRPKGEAEPGSVIGQSMQITKMPVGAVFGHGKYVVSANDGSKVHYGYLDGDQKKWSHPHSGPSATYEVEDIVPIKGVPEPPSLGLGPTSDATLGDLHVGDKFMWQDIESGVTPEESGYFEIEDVGGGHVKASYTTPEGEKVDAPPMVFPKLDTEVVKFGAPGTGEPPLGGPLKEPPEGMVGNPQGLTVQDLPIGTIYAAESHSMDGTTYTMKKIVQHQPTKADDGTLAIAPLASYVPQYLWWPPGASPDIADYESEPESSPESPLEPYKHGKSGKYKYPKLSTLEIGTKFQDKKGNVYTVVEKGGHLVFFSGISGTKYSAPGTSFVKLV